MPLLSEVKELRWAVVLEPKVAILQAPSEYLKKRWRLLID
jgi:hypothetical protein